MLEHTTEVEVGAQPSRNGHGALGGLFPTDIPQQVDPAISLFGEQDELGSLIVRANLSTEQGLLIARILTVGEELGLTHRRQLIIRLLQCTIATEGRGLDKLVEVMTTPRSDPSLRENQI